MGHRHRAPKGSDKYHPSIKDQTSSLSAASPRGPAGTSSENIWHIFEGKLDSAGHYLSDHARSMGHTAAGFSKSALLNIINLVPFKPDAPNALALLKHYVEGNGTVYTFEVVPDEWQVWIVKATHGKAGYYKDLDPYNSGIYDLVNAMGHFDVKVTPGKDGLTEFEISDVYEFGFRKNDRRQLGRHGFPLGDLSESEISFMRHLLPSGIYQNPGGFKEHWEIKKIEKHTILFIPQQFLAEEGTPFPVKGYFTRDVAKTLKAHSSQNHNSDTSAHKGN